jgi:hypothetical protein
MTGQSVKDIRGQVYFMLGAVDKRNIDVFKILRRRVVYDWRSIGAAWRECREDEARR